MDERKMKLTWCGTPKHPINQFKRSKLSQNLIGLFLCSTISYTLNCNLTTGEMNRVLDECDSPRKVAQKMSSNFDRKSLLTG